MTSRPKSFRRSPTFLGGISILTLVCGFQPAFAQTQAAAAEDFSNEDIIVTGSSIRGVPPTGSNLIQMSAQAVVETGASTTQELLSNIPQLGTFNQAPRPDPHSNGILSTAPNIRGLGQAQTLVLVNGHRLVGTGHLQNIADPSIVPPSIISRVEVVADGASSVYGSDGIAGVVNVITRRDYEGATASFRYGIGEDYSLMNTNAVTGSKWDGGGVVVSVEYAKNSRLEGFDRDFITNDFRAQGGMDNRSQNNCMPSSFKVNGTDGRPGGNFIEYGTGAQNVRCDNSSYTDLYPKQERLSFFASGHQEAMPGVELFFDGFYSKTKSDANLAPAGTNARIDRTNPFFPTDMVDASVDSITAYYNVSNLTGVRLKDVQSLEVYGGTIGADVTLNKFNWSTYVTGSRSATDLHEGSFNPGANAAAAAGTTLATALDPFTGQTSDSVKVGLADYEQFFGSVQWLWELNTKIDGPLFALPGGDVKVAVGGVYRKEHYDGKNTLSRIGFMENLGAQVGRRTVYSGFGELFVPIFGDSNAMGGFQRLDLSLSARYDDYSDFGNTFNPKIGINWAPIEGFTLRGSYGKSFHAPALPDLFGPDTRAGFGTGGQNPPGVCGVGSTPGNCIPRAGNIFIAGGNPNLDAEKATTWSAGIDIAPPSLNGFRASLTYYNVDFKGRIAFPTAFGNFFYILPEMNQYFIDNVSCPGGAPYDPKTSTGCTSLPIDPQVVFDAIQGLRLQNAPGVISSPADLPDIYIITDLRRTNLGGIKTNGLDIDLSYNWAWGDNDLGLQFQANRVLKYDQLAVPGAPWIDQFDFGQQKFRARTALSWKAGPATAVATVNYNDKYRNQYQTNTTAQAVETVGSFTTVDFFFSFDLEGEGLAKGTQFTINIDNALNEEPPFLRSGFGYGSGNPLGRVVTLGIRKNF